MGSSSFSNNIIPKTSGDTEYEGSSEEKNNISSSSSSASYEGPKTVWGTPAISFANVTSKEATKEKDEHEEWVNIPEEEVYVGKKNKKKLVLMSTGGRRHAK